MRAFIRYRRINAKRRHRLCSERAVIDGEPITERVVTLTGEQSLARATSGHGWVRQCVIYL